MAKYSKRKDRYDAVVYELWLSPCTARDVAFNMRVSKSYAYQLLLDLVERGLVQRVRVDAEHRYLKTYLYRLTPAGAEYFYRLLEGGDLSRFAKGS